MKPAILLVEPMMAEIEQALGEAYQVHRLFRSEEGTRIEAGLGEIRAAVTGGGTGLSRAWFNRLPRLGLVAINGVGTDKVDLDHAAARAIHVSTTPGVLTGDVADMALALMLGVLRRIAEGDRMVRGGGWGKGGKFPLGTRLAGKRIGILGLGQIGLAVARRAEAFETGIAYWNRSHIAAPAGWRRHESPAALAANSDILVVCVAATTETQGIVSAEVIRALGPQGILINVARGSVADEPALIAALRDGSLGAAGLDVFLNEPAIDPAFFELPNVLLMPHQGSATLETRRDMGRMVLQNLAAFFAGQVPPTSVTAARIAGAAR